jgi:protein-tyrosine phosphatase
MGNICRSPTAHGVFEHHSKQRGWQDFVHVDSAGTHNYHPLSAPDERTQRHALQRGYDLSSLRARQIRQEDFVSFDLILPMDQENLKLTQTLSPQGQLTKIMPFVTFLRRHQDLEVPDPYYGGREGFEHVLDLIEDGVQGVLDHLEQSWTQERKEKDASEP